MTESEKKKKKKTPMRIKTVFEALEGKRESGEE